MAQGGLILIDTSLIIDYIRKKDKQNSFLQKLSEMGYVFSIPSMVRFEVEVGNNDKHFEDWNIISKSLIEYSLDKAVVQSAVKINNELKKSRKQIAVFDLFIAATAMERNLPIATLNTKHFNRIAGLELVELPE